MPRPTPGGFLPSPSPSPFTFPFPTVIPPTDESSCVSLSENTGSRENRSFENGDQNDRTSALTQTERHHRDEVVVSSSAQEYYRG